MSEQRKFGALCIICAYLTVGCAVPYLLTMGRLVYHFFRTGAFTGTIVLLLVGVCGLLGVIKLYILAKDLRVFDRTLDCLPRMLPLAMTIINIVLAIVKHVTKIGLLGTILGVECGAAVIWLTFGLWAYFRYQELEDSRNYLRAQGTKVISVSDLRLW